MFLSSVRFSSKLIKSKEKDHWNFQWSGQEQKWKVVLATEVGGSLVGLIIYL